MKFSRVVAVYIINNNNQILMLKHKKTNNWLPPGGHIEEGEFTHQAAIREVLEETGLLIEFIYDEIKFDYEPARTVESLPVPLFIQLEKGEGFCNEDFVYLAKAKEDIINNKENHEIGWFSLDEALELDIFENVRKQLEYIKNKL